jgi:hypothetical protein
MPRPTPAEIDEKVQLLLSTKETSPDQYETIKARIEIWAEGTTDMMRSLYFPDWTDEDARAVLNQIS